MVCNYRLFRIIFLFLLLVLAHAVLAQTPKPEPQVTAIFSESPSAAGSESFR